MKAAVVLSALLLSIPTARAAQPEIRVICTNIVKGAVSKLFPKFERATGKRVVVTYGASAALKRDIDAGAEFDLVVLTSGVVDALAASGRVAAATRTPIAQSDLAVATKTGSRKSDVTTAAGMKQRLLAAKSITYTKDGGGAEAIERMLRTLEIPLSKVFPQAEAGYASETAASGKYEIAFAPLGEIRAARGALVLGLFPPEFQNTLGIASGVASNPRESAGAQELARFLVSADSLKIIHAAGLSPLSKK